MCAIASTIVGIDKLQLAIWWERYHHRACLSILGYLLGIGVVSPATPTFSIPSPVSFSCQSSTDTPSPTAQSEYRHAIEFDSEIMPLPARVVISTMLVWFIPAIIYIPASCLRAYDYRHGIDIGIGVGVGVVALGGVAKAMSVDIGGLVSLEDSLFGSLWYAHCVDSEVWYNHFAPRHI